MGKTNYTEELKLDAIWFEVYFLSLHPWRLIRAVPDYGADAIRKLFA